MYGLHYRTSSLVYVYGNIEPRCIGRWPRKPNNSVRHQSLKSGIGSHISESQRFPRLKAQQRTISCAAVSEYSLSGRVCYACCTAVNFHGLGPTGRVKVQYSLNSIGSELLPEITAPLFASTV